VASWTNATAGTKGILRPGPTAEHSHLARDYPVAPELQPFVERYWSVRWDRRGLPGYRSEVLAHPTVHLSVETGEIPRFGFRLPAVLVHGVVTRRFVVDLHGWGRVTAAKFRPGGFASLFGTKPRKDTVGTLPRMTSAAATLDPDGLLAAVLEPDTDDARAAALDACLRPMAHEPQPEYLELLDLLAEMQRDRSIVRVEQAAESVGRSVRSLQRMFAGYLGVGPKGVLARYRLHDAVDALDRGPGTDLAELAADLGWFDQAHFNRDFRAAVGSTPTEYLRSTRAID
jgi:AraC-like DNA-binding protein